MVNGESSDRGLSPHKFMPMLGVYKAQANPRIQPTSFAPVSTGNSLVNLVLGVNDAERNNRT